MRAQFVFQEMWIGLRRNLTMTIAVIVTVAISLALFGGGLLVHGQVNAMKKYWFDKVEVSVYLCVPSSTSQQCQQYGPATKAERQDIRKILERMGVVEKVYYESQAEAYKHFKHQFRNNPTMLKVTNKKDLPASFRVKLTDPRKYEQVVSRIKGHQGVESIVDQKDLLGNFFGLLNGLRNAAVFVAIVQVVAAILLIGNTIRLSAYSRRRETGIMRLVGASNFYIQLPFLLEGAVSGLIGGLFAAASVVSVKQFFIADLQAQYPQIAFIGWEAVLKIVALQVIVGVLLSGLASFVTLRRYLRV